MSFHEAHERNYGFCSENEVIQIVNLSVKALGESDSPDLPMLADSPVPEPGGYRETLFRQGEWCKTPIYQRNSLVNGQRFQGPAIIEQMDTTIIVFPGDVCSVDPWGNLIIQLEEREERR